MVETLDRLVARRDCSDGGVELGEIACLDEHLELAGRATAELAAQQPSAFDQPVRLELAEVANPGA
jgi:hypothetical protein